LLSGISSDVDLGAIVHSSGFNWQSQVSDHELCLPESWDALRVSLSRNIKESLRKCYNSLKRDGLSFRLEVAEQPQQLQAALGRFFALHTARARLTRGRPPLGRVPCSRGASFLDRRLPALRGPR